MIRSFLILLLLFTLPSCAYQRAADAKAARRILVGKHQEEIFACMGIPNKKAKLGKTEIWLYKSTNGYTEKGNVASSTSLFNDSDFLLGGSSSIKTNRFCIVQIVMKNKRVKTVQYNGPTGGSFTRYEQCAYAIENCL